MKRIQFDAKLRAYEVAINHLSIEEEAGDTSDDYRARKWLRDKLNKECQKWYNKIKKKRICGH